MAVEHSAQEVWDGVSFNRFRSSNVETGHNWVEGQSQGKAGPTFQGRVRYLELSWRTAFGVKFPWQEFPLSAGWHRFRFVIWAGVSGTASILWSWYRNEYYQHLTHLQEKKKKKDGQEEIPDVPSLHECHCIHFWALMRNKQGQDGKQVCISENLIFLE